MIAALLAIAFADASSTQPIAIQADQFEMLLEERTTTYTGNVVATQGSRSITGNRLVVRLNEDNEIMAMRASGEPARLTDARGDGPISLAGAALDYDFDESVVRAEGDGVLSRDGDTIAAREITYDLEDARARAVGDETHRVTLKLAPSTENRR